MMDPSIIELAAASNLRDYAAAFHAVAPAVGACAIDCAGGVAAFTGAASPLTTVKGAGPVLTGSDVEQAIQFFSEHAASRVTFELAPWVTASELIARGFVHSGNESVMAWHVDGVAEAGGGVIVNPENWANVMQQVWGLPDDPLWAALARAAATLPGAINLGIRDADRWIACAQLAPAAGAAIFCNDATLLEARGRGLQAALIRRRMSLARQLALNPALAEVAPGSTSERNYLRCGFEIAYQRRHYTLELVARR